MMLLQSSDNLKSLPVIARNQSYHGADLSASLPALPKESIGSMGSQITEDVRFQSGISYQHSTLQPDSHHREKKSAITGRRSSQTANSDLI